MKITIGALVGGLILFIWQFMSYGPVLDMHYSQMEYTPHQEEIMTFINGLDLEEGEYFMPRVAKEQADDLQEFQLEQLGKPWAMLQYHESLEHNFFSNLVRALITNSLAVAILCWILLQYAELTMRNSIISALGAGLIGYFLTNYLDAIWYQTNSIPDLIDAIVPWALTGAWLGWWLKR